MSLRLKLLLLGMLTLVLPWGGCRYARQMEAALREGEKNSLQAVAQTIAASLQGRTDYLYREGPDVPEPAASGGPTPASPVPDSATPASAEAATGETPSEQPSEPQPSPYDLQPIMLSAAPYLNG